MKGDVILWLLMMAVILGLAAFGIYLGMKLDSAQSLIREKDAKIEYWKTESGKTVSSKPAAEITKADLKEHYKDVVADLKDMQIKLNQVKAVLKATLEAKGSGVIKVVHDTIVVSLAGTDTSTAVDSLYIDDGYLDLKGFITRSAGSMYSYTYQDSILFALVRKRKGLFGKKELYGQVRMSNPNSRAVGQTSILIRERPKRFYIGAGVNYDPFQNRITPGIQAGWRLIAF
jgi:hypothetical protein